MTRRPPVAVYRSLPDDGASHPAQRVSPPDRSGASSSRRPADWLRRREEHKALLRAARTGLDNLVEFTGVRNARGLLVFEVWSRTRPLRHVVQSTDDGLPKFCTCEHIGPCAHMGATYLYQHPGVRVKPLPELRQHQPRPSDRDHTRDPEVRAAPLAGGPHRVEFL